MSYCSPAVVSRVRRICERASSFGIGLREVETHHGSRFEWRLPTGKTVAGAHIVGARQIALADSVNPLVQEFPALADN